MPWVSFSFTVGATQMAFGASGLPVPLRQACTDNVWRWTPDGTSIRPTPATGPRPQRGRPWPSLEEIREVTGTKHGQTPTVKFSGDKMLALEKLAKHYNIFEDNHVNQANFTVIHIHPADKSL